MRFLRVVHVTSIIALLPLIVNGLFQDSPRSRVGWNGSQISMDQDRENESPSVSNIDALSTTVIDLLSSSTQHSTLLHLLQRCKLVPSVNLMQGLTLFAPTDQAWDNWAKKMQLDQQKGTDAQEDLARLIHGWRTSRPTSRQTSDYVDIDDGFADNIMFDTRQLLLYHMLNYTLPLQQSLTDVDSSYPASHGLPRWIARDSNISTETTLLFPSRHHRPPGNLPPPHPPWAPEGGTGTLGGHAQQIRLLFDQSGPSSVGVDVTGRGGAGVWTNWAGNTTDRHPRPVAGDRCRVGSNGIVVGIDRVLDPPVDLENQIKADSDFSAFMDLIRTTPITIPASDIRPEPWNLSRAEHITIFAPTNAAFDRFDELEKRYLWSEFGLEAREKILEGHLLVDATPSNTSSRSQHAVDVINKKMRLPMVGWRSAYLGRDSREVLTLDNSILNISVDHDTGDMLVNGTKISNPDDFASNGVVHRTESLILPPDYKLLNSPEKVMLSLNASRFVSLLRRTGLAENYTDTKGNMGEGRTFLVPTDNVLESNSVWMELSADFLRGEEQQQGARLAETLKYHILPGRIAPKDLRDGDLLITELELGTRKPSDGDTEQKQRLRVHVDSEKHEDGMDEKYTPSDIRFGGASVIAKPFYADNYIIYLISALNEPPEDVIQTAVSNLELSTFVASLFAAGLDKLVRRKSGVTYFAPTNQAFKDLGLVSRHLLGSEGKDDLRKILKYHALDELVYGADVQGGITTFRTLTGDAILLDKNHTDMDANRTYDIIRGLARNVSGLEIPTNGMRPSEILDTDLLSATGPIHIVNGVQIPPRLNITHGKLLQGAGCSTLIDLLTSSGMDWLLTGASPPSSSDTPDSDAQDVGPLRRPFTILAPSDEAFSRINLTYYLNNDAALLSLLSLHIITSGQGQDSGVFAETAKNRPSYPVMLRDESIFSTLHSVQRFGDVIFRNDGHGSWVVGINAARGVDQQANAARVVEAGRASPIWLTAEDDDDGQLPLTMDETGTVWWDGQSLGGGVITIDRVLIPYEPGWFADWGYLACILGLAGLVLLGLAGYVAFGRRETRGRIRLEGEADEEEEDATARDIDRERYDR